MPFGKRKVAQCEIPYYEVMLLVNSGMPNPRWIICCPTEGYQYIAANLPAEGTPLSTRLGYSGFKITKYEASKELRAWTLGGRTIPALEKALLDIIKGQASVDPLDPESSFEWVDVLKDHIDGKTDYF